MGGVSDTLSPGVERAVSNRAHFPGELVRLSVLTQESTESPPDLVRQSIWRMRDGWLRSY